MTINFFSHLFLPYDILIYDGQYHKQIDARSRFYPIRHVHKAIFLLKGGHYGR